jgi:hypothetical protein
MKVTIGREGLTKSWQRNFPATTPCVHFGCKGIARIGFVAHEGLKGTRDKGGKRVYNLHKNKGSGSYWLHDLCAVAVYFCRVCLETTALYNQG